MVAVRVGDDDASSSLRCGLSAAGPMNRAVDVACVDEHILALILDEAASAWPTFRTDTFRSLSESVRDWTALAPDEAMDVRLLAQPAKMSIQVNNRVTGNNKNLRFFNLLASN